MVRFFYIILLFSLSSCSNINFTEPIPEPERETIFGGPLKFSTETGSFSAGEIAVSNLSNEAGNLSSIPVNELFDVIKDNNTISDEIKSLLSFTN